MSQSGKVVIDPDLYDVQRVEVLRGPQGTLYGSGSMGGTVRVLTNQPKLGTYEGSVQATGSDTQGGSGNGSANLMMNLPIGETLAARVVLSYLYRSGWIDNITVHPFPIKPGAPTYTQPLNTLPVTNNYHDANDETQYGGRVSLLYKPSEDFSILGEAMTQSLHTGGYDLLDGSPTERPAPTALYNAHYEPFPLREGIRDDISIFGLTIKANVGIADLTSATSYFGRTGVQVQDASTSIYYTNGSRRNAVRSRSIRGARSVAPDQPGNPLDLARHRRLSLGGGCLLQQPELGMERNRRQSARGDSARCPTARSSPRGTPTESGRPPSSPTASYKFTDQWKLSAGVRYYQYKSHQDEFSWGIRRPEPHAAPASEITTAKNSGANPRVDLSYMPDGDLTLYATVAKGFRPGGLLMLYCWTDERRSGRVFRTETS